MDTPFLLQIRPFPQVLFFEVIGKPYSSKSISVSIIGLTCFLGNDSGDRVIFVKIPDRERN
jgi:hypothetical protein